MVVVGEGLLLVVRVEVAVWVVVVQAAAPLLPELTVLVVALAGVGRLETFPVEAE
jgi:hypothetical protein